MLISRTMFERTHSLVIPGTESLDLKQTILDQQEQIQNLQTELDAERESAATSASESLSVILRLQVEKAALSMEADHFKRLAEQKICLAELSVEHFHDMIYQKELEIMCLKNQILNLGVSDLVETRMFDQTVEKKMRRLLSSPATMKYDTYQRRTQSMSLEKKLIIQSLDSRKSFENPFSPRGDFDFGSFWGKIKERTEIKDSVRGNYEIRLQDSSVSESFLASQEGIFRLEKVRNSGNFSKIDVLCDPNCAEKIGREIPGLSKESKIMKSSANQSEMERLRVKIERLEEKSVKDQEEELLKEIKEQLELVQTELKSLRPKRSILSDDSSILCIQEAMLSFWL